MRAAIRTVFLLAMAAMAAMAAGCATDKNPPGGGGGDGTGSGNSGGATVDGGAGSPDGASGPMLSGRLCETVNFTTPLSCPTSDLGGIPLNGGGQSATTAADGSFTLALPNAGNVVLYVGDLLEQTGRRTEVARIGDWQFGADLTVPSVSSARWDDLARQLGQSSSQTTLALYVTDTVAPIEGAQIDVADSSQVPFYDTDGTPTWSQEALATGPQGAALVFGVAAPDTGTVKVSVQVDAQTINFQVPVVSGRLTFARLVVPPASP